MEFSPRLLRLLNEVGFERRRSTPRLAISTFGIFAVGTLVGGVLGILFAPSSGKETRGDVLNRIRARLHLDKTANGQSASA